MLQQAQGRALFLYLYILVNKATSSLSPGPHPHLISLRSKLAVTPCGNWFCTIAVLLFWLPWTPMEKLFSFSFFVTVNRLGMDFEFHTCTQKSHEHLHLCMANGNHQELPQTIKAKRRKEERKQKREGKSLLLKAHLVWIKVKYNGIFQPIKNKGFLFPNLQKGRCDWFNFNVLLNIRISGCSFVKHALKNKSELEMWILIRTKTVLQQGSRSDTTEKALCTFSLLLKQRYFYVPQCVLRNW